MPTTPKSNARIRSSCDGVTSLYWQHLLEYEQTRLRDVFLAAMELLEPRWVRHHREGELKRDFEFEVLHCDNELLMKRVQQWLEAYRSGEPKSMPQILHV